MSLHTQFPVKCDGSAFFHSSFFSSALLLRRLADRNKSRPTYFSLALLTKHSGNVFAAECNGMAERKKERERKRENLMQTISHSCVCQKTKCLFTQKKGNHTTGYFSTGNSVHHLTVVPMDFFFHSTNQSNLLVRHGK